ncbi:hypothetical protein LX36DRAFT_347523 [Colletotrichum falcatum]|nr:hypothetical protein LX36DRAFT_347523 [Colletotrichum falcatum]
MEGATKVAARDAALGMPSKQNRMKSGCLVAVGERVPLSDKERVFFFSWGDLWPHALDQSKEEKAESALPLFGWIDRRWISDGTDGHLLLLLLLLLLLGQARMSCRRQVPIGSAKVDDTGPEATRGRGWLMSHQPPVLARFLVKHRIVTPKRSTALVSTVSGDE